jgi:hypothetical protein
MICWRAAGIEEHSHVPKMVRCNKRLIREQDREDSCLCLQVFANTVL